jgi:two-component system CheB/CheR fusion protein
VSVTSAGVDRGSVFTVKLSLLPRSTSPAISSVAAEADVPTRGHRVLVVDDNRDSAESMAMLLQATGHEVRTAHEGPDALAIAPEFRPAFVLLDIGLPGMNGYAVAERLRALPGFDKVVLIAMTGYGQEEDRKRSKQAGFDHHLVKPIDFDKLTEILKWE